MNDRRANTETAWEFVAAAAPESGEAPLVVIRRVLRGRYRLVALAAAILGALGAVAGYHAKPPRYVSHGLVRIDGALTPILYSTQENGIPPMFETFVAAQEAFLGSRTVLDAAVDSPAMRSVGWPAGDKGVAALQRGLEITRGRRENLIAVAVTDVDARRAQAAVNAVLAAFEANVIDPTRETISLKERTLIDRQGDLERRIRTLREEVLEISQQYGSEAVTRVHAARVTELLALEEKIAALDPAHPGAAGPPEQPDRRAELARHEHELVAEIEGQLARYGARHAIIARLEAELDTVRARRALAELAGSVAPPHENELRRRHVARAAALRSEIEGLGRQLVEIAEIEARIRETGDLLWATRRRLDEIRVESARDDMNRISIPARGELPVAPGSDRRAMLSAAGFVFGCLAGGGVIFLIGLIERRARYLEDLGAVETMAPVLGSIPDIDGERPSAAGPCVHQLRNLLELRASDPARNVRAITSADRGEGRTSLTLALASSFAAAGRRVLVVDADLGRGTLSRELGLAGRPGLCDALSGAEPAAHATNADHIMAIPIGTRRGLDAASVSPGNLERILASLRDQYDAVLVDTGPVLGSAEACAVCASCDSVVLTIARGRRLGRSRAALARLEQAKVTCTGVVLNRAQPDDRTATAGGPVAPNRVAPNRVARLVEPAAAPECEPDCPDAIPFVPAEPTAGERKRAA